MEKRAFLPGILCFAGMGYGKIGKMKRFTFNSSVALFLFTFIFILIILLFILMILAFPPMEQKGLNAYFVSSDAFFNHHFVSAADWLVVRLYDDQTVSVNEGGRVTLTLLPSALRLSSVGKKEAFVLAQRGVMYRDVVQVIELIRRNGRKAQFVLTDDDDWLNEKKPSRRIP